MAHRFSGLPMDEQLLLKRSWWLQPLPITEKIVVRWKWPWAYRYVDMEHLRQEAERRQQSLRPLLRLMAEFIVDDYLKEQQEHYDDAKTRR